jgi:hypothetical protein
LTGDDPHWIKARNKDCWAYNPKAKAGEVMVWKGNCQGRLTSGFGEEHWYNGVNQDGTYSAEKLTQIVEGNSVGGIMQGHSHITTPSASYEGVFENGVLKNLVATAATPSDVRSTAIGNGTAGVFGAAEPGVLPYPDASGASHS